MRPFADQGPKLRRIFSFLAVLGLLGCATGPGLRSRMAAYTGASGETLVRDLGVPDKQLRLGDVLYMAYVRQRTQIDQPLLPGDGGFGYGGFGGGGLGYGGFGGPFLGAGGFYGGGLPADVVVWRCETTFALRDDKVASFSLRGNDCD